MLAREVCYRELQLIDKRTKPARLQTTENEPREEEVAEWKKSDNLQLGTVSKCLAF